MRVSGPSVIAIAKAVFRGVPLRPRVATRGTVVAADGTPIDDGLALFFPSPHSYTGEDLLELQVHGSPAVAADVLLATLEAGARLATPGEFTRRAFLGGKLDLPAAEAVADLIDAERRSEARAAAAKLTGGLATVIDAVADSLDELVDALVGSLDFPDEIEAPEPSHVHATLGAVVERLEALGDGWERGRIVREGMTIAIVGPPNAGKSSALNALLGVDRALVSAEPGTTRDTIEERLALERGAYARIIDTAGLRNTENPLEAAGIARTEAALASASFALIVLDGSLPLEEAALTLLALTADRPRLILFNKADIDRVGYDGRPAGLDRVVLGSVRWPETIDDVRRELAAAARSPGVDLARPHLGTARQADRVFAALGALRDGIATLEAGMPVDLVASDLIAARAALRELTGRETSEAILDGIFARFCVGK